MDRDKADGIVLPDPSVRVRVRVPLTLQFAKAAALFCRLALEVENDECYESANLSSKHQAFVTAAIFHGVAFAEAGINQVFGDARENPKHGVVKDLPSEVKTGLACVPQKCLRYMDLKTKLKRALDIANRKDDFDRGRQPWQDAFLAVKLRNSLVHHRPEWVTVVDTGDPSKGTVQDLEHLLRNKFKPNPWVQGGDFLTKYLSHGCAQWVVRSMRCLMDEFYRVVGMEAPYALSRERGLLDTQ